MKRQINYQAATQALRERLNPGNQTLVALDFCHLLQKKNEPVSDFIGQLEKVKPIYDTSDTSAMNIITYMYSTANISDKVI